MSPDTAAEIHRISQLIIGKRIIGVRYMTPDESRELFWSEAAPVIVLDDGTEIRPQSDDEGNAPGALDIANSAKDSYDLLGTIRH